MNTYSVGKNGEDLIIQLFNINGIVSEKEKDLTKKYDHDLVSKIGSQTFTCEVKFDMMAQKTGNLAIEYHNSKLDKPSGLSVTKADIWVHLVKDGDNTVIFATSVSSLLKFTQTHKPLKTIKNGGDGNANLYIYKLEDIQNIFTRLDNIDSKTLQSSIRKILKEKT